MSVPTPSTRPPLVAHVIHRMDTGGMENGLVNLINATPPGRYRHAVICLTGFTDFAQRIQADGVGVYALGKREGKSPATYFRLWRLLRSLRPDLVHTRNLAAIEGHLPAMLARVPHRVHGEHGRDVGDLDGGNRKYRWLRRAYRPLIDAFIPLSADLETYLRQGVRVPEERITRIPNGVDVDRFRPAPDAKARFRHQRGWDPETLVIGWVGRMEPVKNPVGLVEAFARLVECYPQWRERLALVMVGNGSQAPAVREALDRVGLADRAWLPGTRSDIPELLPGLDLFALPSLAEGISNTTLEAMASGVPVVATEVGGNAELVDPASAGRLVAPDDPGALVDALAGYLGEPERLAAEARAARLRVVERFSIHAMVGAYLDVYDRLLARRAPGAVGGERIPS